MARAQNSPRGLFAKKRIDVGAAGSIYAHSYSSSTSLLSADSTGLQVAGGIKVGRVANAAISSDSTGLVTAAAIKVANKANAKITGNSTGLQIIALLVNGTTRVLNANSTGIKMNGRYLSTNTTGNNTT